MAKFGKYAILSNSRHVMEKEPEWWWDFRPTTSRDELELLRFLENTPDASWIDVAWKELSLSFGGTNITDENGQPILPPDATPDQVMGVLKEMPLEMVVEIWKALGEVHPLWGPKLPPEGIETSTTSSPS
jgi:hypothetical protein